MTIDEKEKKEIMYNGSGIIDPVAYIAMTAMENEQNRRKRGKIMTFTKDNVTIGGVYNCRISKGNYRQVVCLSKGSNFITVSYIQEAKPEDDYFVECEFGYIDCQKLGYQYYTNVTSNDGHLPEEIVSNVLDAVSIVLNIEIKRDESLSAQLKQEILYKEQAMADYHKMVDKYKASEEACRKLEDDIDKRKAEARTAKNNLTRTKNKLEFLEQENAELKNANDELKARCENVELPKKEVAIKCVDISETEEPKKDDKDTNIELIEMRAERNVYKKLYEDLLSTMIISK